MRWDQRKHWFLFWAGGACLMPLICTCKLLLHTAQRAALLSASSAVDQDPSIGLWLMIFSSLV